MSTHKLAQGLASLGRNGDSLLMHVQPEEVAGLQALAESHGTSLTINPDTGMPEAFSLGGMLSAALPAAAGFMFGGPLGAELGVSSTMGSIAAGALTGAALAAMTDKNPLMGGLMGGLGGYGGGELSNAVAAYGTPASTMGGDIFSQIPASTIAENPEGFQAAANLNAGLAPANQAAQTAFENSMHLPISASQQVQGAQAGFSTASAATPLQTGINKVMQSPMDFLSQKGNMMKVGMPVASAVMGGLEPSDFMNQVNKPNTDKYDPNATLNLGGDTGLKLLASGGAIDSYSTGGNYGVYTQPDTAPVTPQLSQDGYGLGRLNSLSQTASAAMASNYGSYAEGGMLNGHGDGMSDSIPATIEGKQPARLADGEFVVPADVVSHIGNGSSKAGAQRLYAMMDKVRQARTGTKKQGKQINPNKYLPG